MSNKNMYHFEGGWPKDFDYFGDEKRRKMYIKKNIERSKDGTGTGDRFLSPLRKMCQSVSNIIMENNQIDMFEEYFENDVSDHNIEKLNVRTLMLFKDPCKTVKRSISKISWHPDGPDYLAAAYSIMRFQKQPDDMDYTVSYHGGPR